MPFDAPGHIPENLRDVRQELDQLKAEVAKNALNETPDQRRDRIKMHLPTLAAKILTLRNERELQKGAVAGFGTTPSYQKLQEIDTALIKENGVLGDVTAEELIDGLTEGEVKIDPVTGDVLMTEAGRTNFMKLSEIQDEVALLRTTMDMYEKMEDGAVKLFEKIPANIRSTVESLGITSFVFASMFIDFLARAVDKGPLRPFSKKIREASGIAKASNEGVSDAAIDQGRLTWNTKYDDWMVRSMDPNNQESPPDLYLLIKGEEAEVRRQADFAALKTRFEADAVAMALFGGALIDLQLNGSAKAVQPAAANWKISLPATAVHEDPGPPPTFSLTPEGERMKQVFDSVSGSLNITEVRLGDFELTTGGVCVADIAGGITPLRLQNAEALMPTGGGKFSTVKLGGDLMSLTPTAKFENGVLTVNYHTLDNALQATSLNGLANAAAATTTWKWNNATNTWNVV